MDSSNSSDKVTISKIPIHHQKLKSKQLEERLIKKKITDVQFLQSFIHYSNEKQSHQMALDEVLASKTGFI